MYGIIAEDNWTDFVIESQRSSDLADFLINGYNLFTLESISGGVFGSQDDHFLIQWDGGVTIKLEELNPNLFGTIRMYYFDNPSLSLISELFFNLITDTYWNY